MSESSDLIQKIISTDSCYAEMFEGHGKAYTFLNPVSYLLAVKNKGLYSRFDGVFVDGKFLALAICFFYWKRLKRRSFDMTSVAPELFRYSEIHEKSIYIVAGRQSEIERAVEIYQKYYPRLNVVGFRNGFFAGEDEIDREIKKIIALSPGFVICGMGAIRQECFLDRLKTAGYQGISFTCGGFISQTSKAQIDYYPKIFNVLNLRFVYRMIKEKHTRKRYLLAIFTFPIVFVKEWFWGKINKRQKNGKVKK